MNENGEPLMVQLVEHIARIDKLLHHEQHGLEKIYMNQLHILERMDQVMTVADDIKADLATVSANTSAEGDLATAIKTRFDGLDANIATLQQQIADLTAAGGGGLTAADVTEIQASVAALKDGSNSVKAALDILANTPAAPAP